jgi:hypothetical protein
VTPQSEAEGGSGNDSPAKESTPGDASLKDMTQKMKGLEKKNYEFEITFGLQIERIEALSD